MTTVNFGAMRINHIKFIEAGEKEPAAKLTRQKSQEVSKKLIDRLDLNGFDIQVAPNMAKGEYKGPVGYLTHKGTTNSGVTPEGGKVRLRSGKNFDPENFILKLYLKAKDNGLVPKK